LHELNTNTRIKPLTVQFVPLKVVTAGATWGNWARKYPPQGQGIPFLYVIRADGKLLYGQSGSKSGQELGQFMAEHLREAGRLLNDREVEFLETVVTAAKEHLAEGQKSAAVQQIATLSQLGTVGDLKSYSRLALEANDLAKQLIEEGLEQIENAASQLDLPKTQLDGALALAEAKTAYKGIAEVSNKVTEVYREAYRDPDKKQVLAQADAINRALARRKVRGGDKLAVRDLKRVIQRYPDTPGARLAAKHVAEISGETVASQPPAGGDEEFRTWTGAQGKHQIEAKLVAIKKGWVQLQTRNGKKISLQVKKLSQADQDFLAQ
jgi:hypothetical protein